jgi:hypothetical protein
MKIVLTLTFAFTLLTAFNASSNNTGEYSDRLEKDKLKCESDLYMYKSWNSFKGNVSKTSHRTPTLRAVGKLDTIYHPCIVRSLIGDGLGMAKNKYTAPKAVQDQFKVLIDKYTLEQKENDPDVRWLRQGQKEYKEMMAKRKIRHAKEAQELLESERFQKKVDAFYKGFSDQWDSTTDMFARYWASLSAFTQKLID